MIAVNWMEDEYGGAPGRLERMLEKIHPSIRVVEGKPAAGAAFGGVHSLPAVFIFDQNGRLVFRQGGEHGPNGRFVFRREQLARVIRGLR